jgi:hypothetical protein
MAREPFARRCRWQRGITLLELLLALALSGVVMGVITMAIDLNLRTLDTGRAEVEQARLAQAVLRHIADDIRNAVAYQPIDLSSARQTAAGADVAGIMDDGFNPDDLGGFSDSGIADFDLGLDASLEAGLTINTLDIEGTVEPTGVPGLYGNQFELQVDVSRLPRIDQYERVLSAEDPTASADIPSDVKTISYYLRTEEGTGIGIAGSGETVPSLGLIRRQLDRAVASWSAENGTLDAAEYPGQVLAAEVNYLEFRYFDGTDWLTEWDSEAMGSLPLAVEITIGIDPSGGRELEEMDVGQAADATQQMAAETLHRLVVHLPMGKAVLLEDMMLEGEMSSGMEGLDLDY